MQTLIARYKDMTRIPEGGDIPALHGVRALMVDYRLAPAHPFPAALDDSLTAYRWLLKQGYDAANIVMAGDSAGGNLTLSMLMALRDNGEPLPAAAAWAMNTSPE